MKKKQNVLIELFNTIPDFLQDLFTLLKNKKLRVCLLSYHYEEPIMSGVGVHVRNLARYLSKNNCEVHVFCSGIDNSVYNNDGVIVHNIERLPIPLKNAASKKRFNYFLFESEAVRQVIRESQRAKFDILHSHGMVTKSAFILKNVLDLKWIHTFHAIETARVKELIKEEQKFDDMITWMESNVNHCNGAIYVSDALKKEGQKHHSIKSVRVIPNGIDLDQFRYHKDSKKNLLFVGRFSKEKGVDILPELSRQVMKETKASITIISPSNILEGELKTIRSEIKDLQEKYPGRIVFIEHAMSQEDLSEFYTNCQVYIQPSKYESFGLCILEAMATGKAVVTFDVGGTKEVVGDSGFAVKTRAEFIKKTVFLLNNKDLCRTIGYKAQMRARIFDWDKISKDVINYYEEIIK